MRFLIDAQLPRRLAFRLREAGHDAVHTLDLPRGNRTPDGEILDIADAQERVVVTKDADFLNSFYVYSRPKRLLLISTGNISNAELEQLLFVQLEKIEEALVNAPLVELASTLLIIHG